MTTFIALLRAVNVGGRRVPMADLRDLLESLGYEKVQTYIASGNVVFWMHGAPSRVNAQLEEAIATRFKLDVPVILRTATQWARYAPSNPFPEASATAPNAVLLGLAKKTPPAGAVEQLRARAVNGERIEQVGDGIWFHYAQGVADSKLTPTFIDKVVGSPLTARNWNTVQKLGEMADVG